MRRVDWFPGAALAIAPLLGCSPSSQAEQPVRSPSRDYPHPSPQTSDAQIVGVDDKDSLTALGEQDTGWEIDSKGIRYRRETRGGAHPDPPTREEE